MKGKQFFCEQKNQKTLNAGAGLSGEGRVSE